MSAHPSPPSGLRAAIRHMTDLVNSRLSRPDAAVLLAADDLLVEVPAAGTVWTAGADQRVRWMITGPVDPVDIHLVQRDGGSIVTRAVLARELPAHGTSVTVTVPADTAPGEYLVLVTSQGLLDAYSRPFRITRG
ncbi:GPI anchored serine-threonine rich family protein [Streptomyces sp. NPDC048507]|uniref:GPI anchored serine-threonine rich family protein n=1 Tax=Streptomyces sp. NPDC048507 TaxID=3365560 RepID=UPI0037150372